MKSDYSSDTVAHRSDKNKTENNMTSAAIKEQLSKS